MATQRRPATDDEARALASALRLRILRICLEPRTNKEIAEALGRDPASILHHVRRLVDTGFLVAQPVRRGTRGSREIPYLATRKSWQLETPAKGRALLEAFLEEVALAPAEELVTSRLGLRLAQREMTGFIDRLGALLDEYAQRPDDPAARPFSLFLAIHPDVARERASQGQSDQRAAVPST